MASARELTYDTNKQQSQNPSPFFLFHPSHSWQKLPVLRLVCGEVATTVPTAG
jgi:hypothetical protein